MSELTIMELKFVIIATALQNNNIQKHYHILFFCFIRSNVNRLLENFKSCFYESARNLLRILNGFSKRATQQPFGRVKKQTTENILIKQYVAKHKE